MNFDDIKSAWEKDPGSDIKIPDQLENIRRAVSPVEKVKRNIRGEMWTNIGFLILFFVIPFMFDRLAPEAKVFYFTILVMTLLPMSYYFYNFYKFYGRLNKLELNTRDNVEEAYFDLRYATEIYKVMQHFTSPNFFLMGIVIGLGPKFSEIIDLLYNFFDLPVKTMLLTIGVVLGLFLVFIGYFFLIRYQVHHYYGKYLDQLREIRGSLRED